MSTPRIGHIGVIVDDLDRAIALFDNLFDLRPARVHAMEDVGIVNKLPVQVRLAAVIGADLQECWAPMGALDGCVAVHHGEVVGPRLRIRHAQDVLQADRVRG